MCEHVCVLAYARERVYGVHVCACEHVYGMHVYAYEHCVHVHACEHVCVNAYTREYACGVYVYACERVYGVHVEAVGPPCLSSSETLSTSFDTGSFTGMELDNWVRLAGSRVSQMCLGLPLQL